jgi:hypothetical protein
LHHLEAAIRCRPSDAEEIHAWRNEIQFRSWEGKEVLEERFERVDASEFPVVIFCIGAPALFVETLVDEWTGVMLITNTYSIVQ